MITALYIIGYLCIGTLIGSIITDFMSDAFENDAEINSFIILNAVGWAVLIPYRLITAIVVIIIDFIKHR